MKWQSKGALLSAAFPLMLQCGLQLPAPILALEPLQPGHHQLMQGRLYLNCDDYALIRTVALASSANANAIRHSRPNSSHLLFRTRSNKNKLSVIRKADADRHRLLQGWRVVRIAICAPRQLLQRRRLRRIWRLLRRLLLLPCWQLRPRLLRGSQPCRLDGLHGVGRGPRHARRGPRYGGGREWSKPDCTQRHLEAASSPLPVCGIALTKGCEGPR